MNATRPVSRFLPRFARNRYMYRIDGCVSSSLIQYMCKSVQSSFDNCILKLKRLGKDLLSLTKYGPISRTAVFLVYRRKRYLMKNKAAIVREYLKQEKVIELPHPPYFARSCPLWLFPILEAQKHLAGRKYQTRKNLGSAIFQCLNSISRKDYENAFENWIKRLKLCVSHGILKDWDKDFGIVC